MIRYQMLMFKSLFRWFHSLFNHFVGEFFGQYLNEKFRIQTSCYRARYKQMQWQWSWFIPSEIYNFTLTVDFVTRLYTPNTLSINLIHNSEPWSVWPWRPAVGLKLCLPIVKILVSSFLFRTVEWECIRVNELTYNRIVGRKLNHQQSLNIRLNY